MNVKMRPTCLSRLAGWSGIGMVFIAVTILVGALGVLVGEWFYSDRIYPNIHSHGLDLSYQNDASARDLILQRYAAFLYEPITLTYHDQTWQPSAAELGVAIDPDRTLETALTLGHAETRIDSALTIVALWEQGIDVPLSITIDQQVLQHYLLQIAAEVDQPPRDAMLMLEDTAVTVTSEQPGLQVLVDETVVDITAALQTLNQQSIALRTRILEPTVQRSDLNDLAHQVRTILDGPVVFVSNASNRCQPECRWRWTPTEIATWIRLYQRIDDQGNPDTILAVDQSAIRKALAPIAQVVNRDGGLPRVDWNGGSPVIIEQGTPGLGLNVTLATAHFNTALQGGPRTMELPLTEIPPPVISSNLNDLGLTELLGVGVSSFRGSAPYRITNIQAGSRQMHGILIPPGGHFSFNQSLGPVTPGNGFVQGYAIIQDRTQLEWGGGLCQVSTTMFRASFWAGLPITERHEHSFRIEWYEELGEPPGFDAAIFTGVSDMGFANDTGGWLLLQTYVDLNRQQLTIMIYGGIPPREIEMGHRILGSTAKPARPVYVDDPTLPRGTVKQTDWARGGLQTELYRTVLQDGQVIHQDTFKTTFEPWPDIYRRGTG